MSNRKGMKEGERETITILFPLIDVEKLNLKETGS
jgi:hypothetical protein